MSCQQYELYGAEQSIVADLSLAPLTRREAQDLVDDWRATSWFERNFPDLQYVEIRVRRSSADGSVGGLSDDPRIALCEMAPVHMNALYLAHEVSHPLAQSRYGSRAHDPWFSRTYLQLVYAALGSDAYKALFDAFERANIDHRIDE